MTINGERVRQARELRGLTQMELAQRLGVNQSTVASIEGGRWPPSNELVESIALGLGFPPAFFRQASPADCPLGSLLLYRARASVTAREEAQAYRYAQTIYEWATRLSSRVTTIPLRLPQLEGTPESAADVTRVALGLSPDTPIHDLVRTIERAGVLVLALPFALKDKDMDAFSLWAGGKPVIVLLRVEYGDRLRHSLAHELGHLVMHQPMKSEINAVEREAERFAGAFLLPKSGLESEMALPLTLTGIAALKPRWGVSMQAIIMRALDIEVITPRQRKYLFQQLTMRGWRKHEPDNLQVPLEKPRALRQMAELLYGTPINYERLASEIKLPEAFLRETMEAYAGVEIKPESNGRVLAFPDAINSAN